MEESKLKILVVDDEPFNLEILSEYLHEEGYETELAENGEIAWDLLEKSPEGYSAVLLDRMMPRMDGMEVLHRIKAHSAMKTLPVIMQTAKSANEDVLEGLQAGAYYYLTKPYKRDQLLAIVRTAVDDHQAYRGLRHEVLQTTRALSMMSSGQFHFKTLEEGKGLAALLAYTTSEPDQVAVGLAELLINAVEHGNLGISYETKSKLNDHDAWELEVQRRLALPENANKQVTLEFERTGDEVRFIIRDQGDGFVWDEFMEISPERAFHTHGRGIALAKNLSFSRLEYQGKGNQVLAVVAVNPAQSE